MEMRPPRGRTGGSVTECEGVIGSVWKQWKAVLLLGLLGLAADASAHHGDRDHAYLVTGQATTEQTPARRCAPEMLAGLDQHAQIPAPAEGWSGAPQAVDVFNVFAGEVMLRQGDRQICGRMHDARTRDSRFRAGIGLVVVPEAGSREPIHVAWRTPLRERWIPTLRLGGPSPVQQADTFRLIVRTACMAIALALAFSALMGFVGARDRAFLNHTVICLMLLLWQAVLSGLSGYPEPWLPVGDAEAWWLLGLSFTGSAALLYGLWALSGGVQLWPRLRHLSRWVTRVLLALAVVTPLLPYAYLPFMAALLDLGFAIACVAILVVACVALWRRDSGALRVVVALVPFLAMTVGDLCDSHLLLEYRVEAIQLSITWFLIVMAYALKRRYGQLREQRDAMQLLADTDALTGLPNRRAGLARLERLLRQARSSQRELAVGFVDIDLFKRINDVYGHAVGDRVLVAVADALGASVRERRDVVRMGGEEFLVLLPGIGGATAQARLESMRRRVGEAGARLGVAGLDVTASIGLATLRAEDADSAALLRRADEAMYRAKQAGRDRVVDAAAAATERSPAA